MVLSGTELSPQFVTSWSTKKGEWKNYFLEVWCFKVLKCEVTVNSSQYWVCLITTWLCFFHFSSTTYPLSFHLSWDYPVLDFPLVMVSFSSCQWCIGWDDPLAWLSDCGLASSFFSNIPNTYFSVFLFFIYLSAFIVYSFHEYLCFLLLLFFFNYDDHCWRIMLLSCFY